MSATGRTRSGRVVVCFVVVVIVVVVRRHALARLPVYRLQPGNCVLELRPAGADKGSAILAFLEEMPFKGRVPVFAGDDLTDEPGFSAVNAHGGISMLVGDRAGSAARFRLPDPAAIHAWLGVPAVDPNPESSR